jgi:hypothetical protein
MWLVTPNGFYSIVAKTGDQHNGLLDGGQRNPVIRRKVRHNE